MKKIKVKLKNISGTDQITVPRYETPGSAGIDLRANLEREIVVLPGNTAKVPTGWAMQLPDSKAVALLFARSGLAAQYGVALTNGVGVIDSDYRGEIQVLVSNNGQEAFTIRHGDRIAQMLFLPVLTAEFEVAEKIDDTQRGEGGFGSTGISN
ncbi:MAG: dUTP diphosphatase [Desulfitobacteriaceae bacterium]|nr:dUTP diphosphatase [Desulfitobacteriaceae bacterium]MDD4345578.1 dUTP diphosphatase [Desulfitobacteriaceae bacterium]MDD4401537.1 dUTP diphosphatase [Desulfitobacteriaceae bacterium]